MSNEYIIIGFSRPRKFKLFSWIIRKVEHSEYSHVYIKTYSNTLERWLIYQASGTAVNFIGQERFYNHNEPIVEYLFQTTDKTKHEFLQLAVDTVGTPYGVKQLVGIGLVRLGKLFGLRCKNPFRDGKATYVCSELAAELLETLLGVDIEQDLDCIGPKELQQIIANRETYGRI